LPLFRRRPAGPESATHSIRRLGNTGSDEDANRRRDSIRTAGSSTLAAALGGSKGRSYNGPAPHSRESLSLLQRMSIYGVSFDMVGKQPIVLLKTVDGNKFLPIWIGHPEAAAILMKLQGASTPRPMTHDLLSEVLESVDAKCEKVSVTELRDNTFYASITISMNGSELEIDSRPSDALALAVRCSAPIFAADDVIEESAIEFEHEVEDTEEVVEKFKDFLDNVSPEDFAAGEGEEEEAEELDEGEEGEEEEPGRP
jgi:bifunctional DNase/RNase